nr:uncharacterized protein LOC131783268 isoform X1 [Pocillopora verrucosa]
MDAFDIRRAELLHSTSDSRDWYLLNSKICGIPVGKFMSSSPLVSSFPKEFNTVQLSNLKNGGHLDRRLVHKEEVFIASSFDVVSAILRQKIKAGEEEKYSGLIDGINSLNIGQDNEDCQTATDTRDNNKDKIHDPVQTVFGVDSRSAISIENIEKSQDENLKLKAKLEVVLPQLEALRDEVKNGGQSTLSSGTQDPAKDNPDSTSDMWTLIGDVCDKFQVPLASLFADQVDQNVEVAKVMSDIAEQLLRKRDPKQALEAILGDSAPKFFKSLRVPDWTLLYFKLQSRIPDQGWQTLLNFTKLGRTKTKSDIPLLLNKNHIKAVRKMIYLFII